nr:MAG TPA: Protein of unknown function (DUF669) [Caudoviricetes sp.]
MDNKSIFEKWNKSVDLQGLKADIKTASENQGGNFVDVPADKYEVKLAKAEVRATKNGDPMATLQFKILEGEYKGQYIWMNQVITQGFQIHIMDEFLNSLDTGVQIDFEDYSQYNDLLMDISEECESQKLSYALNYGVNAKGYKTFEIEEVFEG